ncbi:glycosyltransferase [Hwanghaeella grinnelliae]|uniref:Glycosyltransferase n=1 Tax=Hwanghaeella grinnelliae TaxID=2500179 RepID=A0A437QNN0_9PROT|nr:glycosyltransferase [Hwanghaeella grinnelliae]RVU36153.1 glycosyltransferase [Hwanghaeella grinnelliae]
MPCFVRSNRADRRTYPAWRSTAIGLERGSSSLKRDPDPDLARHHLKTPTVGVVIPSNNSEATLARAVRSVLAQSHSNWQLVIVDDASARDQKNAVADLIQDDRIRTIRLEVTGGAGNARNIGIRALDTEWIAFLDAGDEWTPDKLREQLSYIQRLDAPVSLCASAFIQSQNRDGTGADITYRFPAAADRYDRLVSGCDIHLGSTLLARRDVFERHGYFEPELRCFEGWDWLLRCSLGGESIAVASNAIAIVHDRSQPPRDNVSAGARLLLRKNLKPVARRSILNAARFLSATFLERAVAAWRGGGKIAGFCLGGLAFAVWPFRGRRFFGRVLRALFNSGGNARRQGSDARPNSVMHVISGLEVGGAENMLVQLVEELEGRGIPQYVVNLKSGGRHEARIKALIGDRYSACGISGAGDIFAGFKMLRAALSKARPKSLQGWMYHGDLFATLAHICLPNRNATDLYWGVRCSNMDFSRYRLQLKATVLLCKYLSFLPRRITSNSIAGLQSHIAFGYDNRRLSLVQNCVDMSIYRKRDDGRDAIRASLGIPADAFVFAIVARTDPMKGYDVFQAVAEGLPDMTALAAGLGTDALPGPANLRGLGVRHDVPDILTAVDVLVSTSHFGEGQSNSILEGMASGLPIVATDTGDSARLVGPGGMVVRPGHIDGFVTALRFLRDNPGECAALGDANRARVEREFSRAEMANQYLAIYGIKAVEEA